MADEVTESAPALENDDSLRRRIVVAMGNDGLDQSRRFVANTAHGHDLDVMAGRYGLSRIGKPKPEEEARAEGEAAKDEAAKPQDSKVSEKDKPSPPAPATVKSKVV